jgi:hypothetical protein
MLRPSSSTPDQQEPFGFVLVIGGMTADQYDRVVAKLPVELSPDLLVHVSGPCEEGWRIIQVWRSGDAYAAYEREILWPALRRSGVIDELNTAPRSEELDVDHLITGGRMDIRTRQAPK